MSLLLDVRASLAARSDATRAPKMQAYMKSAMPYHGVAAPEVRAIAKTHFATLALPDVDAYRAAVLELWRGATHREERYVALALTRHRMGGKKFRTPDLLPLYEELIVTGAWWDYVDELACHPVAELARAHPAVLKPLMRTWSRDPNLWKRRTSIIFQNGAKDARDVELLHFAIEGSIDDKDFFARKAIGWALREHAKTDSTAVEAYVRKNAKRLSGLSKREALKAQLADGTITELP
jgi:3-methyladenine DNA glycosylase AlkD